MLRIIALQCGNIAPAACLTTLCLRALVAFCEPPRARGPYPIVERYPLLRSASLAYLGALRSMNISVLQRWRHTRATCRSLSAALHRAAGSLAVPPCRAHALAFCTLYGCGSY